MSRADEPAAPTIWHNNDDLNASAPDGSVVAPDCVVHLHGLTIREHFAGLAMQAILTGAVTRGCPSREWSDQDMSVKVADALLAALSQVRE